MSNSRRGFTLIELLVVVAIIGILAAIAVPNFLEAQVRAKVSRAKVDIRAFSTALESYAVDHNAYPYPATTVSLRESLGNVIELTTPVAYISSVSAEDIFRPDWDPGNGPQPIAWKSSYGYYNYAGYIGAMSQKANPLFVPFAGYCLVCVGPDRTIGALFMVPYLPLPNRQNRGADYFYDPTNGSVSPGDIGRWTGKPSVFSAF